MKLKAIFTVEFEADDDGANAQYLLEQALARARVALKDSIEQGEPGSTRAQTGIRPGSTSITVTSQPG
jgi:hypothetical protein